MYIVPAHRQAVIFSATYLDIMWLFGITIISDWVYMFPINIFLHLFAHKYLTVKIWRLLILWKYYMFIVTKQYSGITRISVFKKQHQQTSEAFCLHLWHYVLLKKLQFAAFYLFVPGIWTHHPCTYQASTVTLS